MANHHEIFDGGQSNGHECLSLEPGQLVKVLVRKGQEIQIWPFHIEKDGCFFQPFDFVWLPGGATCNLVMPGDHYVVLGGHRVLQGGCLMVLGHKMKVSESLGKGDFGPLAPRGMGSVGSVLHYCEESDPKWCKAGEKSVLG